MIHIASESISLAIIVIASIIVASSVAATFLLQINTIDSFMKQTLRKSREKLETSIEIIDIAVNTSLETKYFVIYLKNVGNTDISLTNINLVDIYVNDNHETKIYKYDENCVTNCWKYFEIIEDNVWSKGETIIITLYNRTSHLPPVSIKIVLPNGVKDEHTYFS